MQTSSETSSARAQKHKEDQKDGRKYKYSYSENNKAGFHMPRRCDWSRVGVLFCMWLSFMSFLISWKSPDGHYLISHPFPQKEKYVIECLYYLPIFQKVSSSVKQSISIYQNLPWTGYLISYQFFFKILVNDFFFTLAVFPSMHSQDGLPDIWSSAIFEEPHLNCLTSFFFFFFFKAFI